MRNPVLVSECFRLCILYFHFILNLFFLISYDVCLPFLDVPTSKKITQKRNASFFPKRLPTSKKNPQKRNNPNCTHPKNVGKPRVISFCFANQPLILRLLRVTWKSLSFYHRNRLRQLGMPKILCWKVKGFITSNIP